MREPIAASDAIWLQDSDTNLMVINAILITDRLDPETLRAVFQARIFEGPDPGRFERLRCRITGSSRTRWWERDPDFDLSRHIVEHRGKPLHTLEAVQEFVGREAGQKLDWDHPRWQIQVIEGFEDGATALLVRIHHSIGDGEALVALLFTLVDEHSSHKRNPVKATPPPSPWLTSLAQAVAIPLSAPGILLRRLTWWPDRSPMHGAALSGRKRVAWTQPLDLEVIKRAKHLIGATVNDVLMASVSGAFSHYLTRMGDRAPDRFLISMPVNVRRPIDPLHCDNHFAPVPLELPAGGSVPRLRILAVKTRMDHLKGSAVPVVIYELQRALLAFLPQAVSRRLIDFLANKCTAVVTNISGPSGELSLAGRRVRSIIFWVPQRARIGIGISILSFSSKVQIGVIADEALLPDPGELVQAFEEEFEALKAL